MGKILVVGSSNTDLVIKVARIPAPGETILGGTFIQSAGGKGANQAVAAARCGGEVTFIANTGEDNLGQEARKGFQKDGIDISHVSIDKDQPSGVALIFVADNGENSIAVAPGANATLNVAQIAKASKLISQHDILLTQLEIPIDTVYEAVKIAQANGVKVILNPAPAQELSDALLSQVDIITPNETEAALLTGVTISDEKSMRQAADKLRAKGVETVIITLGSKGAYILSEKVNKIVDGFKVEAVDTTAAGDTFNGALAFTLAQHMELAEAVTFAQAAAAISVTRMGAQTSAPRNKEITEFLKSHL